MCKNVLKRAYFLITFFCTFKRAIAHFQNGRLPNPACLAICTYKNSHTFAYLLFSKVQLCNRTAVALNKKCDCAIALFCCSFKKCNCAISLFCCFFKKCDCVITLFSHFSKVQQKVQSHNLSFKKSKWAKCLKNVQISKSHFICTLKRAIAHFQSERLPSPD